MMSPSEVIFSNYNVFECLTLGEKTTHEKFTLESFDGGDKIHRVPVLLNSKSKSQQKRKFDEYVSDGIFTTSFEHVGWGNYGSENVKSRKRCSSFPTEPVFPNLDGKGESCAFSTKDYSHLSDSKDSTKGPCYPMNQGSLKNQPRDLKSSSSFSLSKKTFLEDKPKMQFVEVKSLVDPRTKLSLNLIEEDEDLVTPLNGKFLPARDNNLPRPVIPIGPRFQADVPNWEHKTNIKQPNSDDDLKWLGTQIWPIPIPVISET